MLLPLQGVTTVVGSILALLLVSQEPYQRCVPVCDAHACLCVCMHIRESLRMGIGVYVGVLTRVSLCICHSKCHLTSSTGRSTQSMQAIDVMRLYDDELNTFGPLMTPAK